VYAYTASILEAQAGRSQDQCQPGPNSNFQARLGYAATLYQKKFYPNSVIKNREVLHKLLSFTSFFWPGEATQVKPASAYALQTSVFLHMQSL
jgi:hypothetical protein